MWDTLERIIRPHSGLADWAEPAGVFTDEDVARLRGA